MEITKTDKKILDVCIKYIKAGVEKVEDIDMSYVSMVYFTNAEALSKRDEIELIRIFETFISEISGSITYYRLTSSDKRNLAILLRDLIEYDEEVGLDTNLIRSLTKIINKLKMKHLMGV